MAKWLSSIDLTQNELQNAVIQNLAAAPGVTKKGLTYFNTSVNIQYTWDGTKWLRYVDFDTVGAANGVATLDASSKLTASQMPVATTTVVGGVKDGTGVTIAGDGTLSVDYGSSSGTAVQGNDTRVTADQAAGTASIRTLGTGAQQAAAGNHTHAYLPLSGGTLTGALTLAADPVSALQPATKQYVDNVAAGLDPKGSVRVATTANITLSGVQTIDGVSVVAGNRVLVKNQTNAYENGIYIVAAGAWTLAPDANISSEITSGMYTYVEEGTTNGATGWVLTTTGAINLGTTALTFSQFSGAGTTVDWSNVTNKPALVSKYSANIGNGVLTSIPVTHNLNTMDVTITVREASAPYSVVFTDITVTGVNGITLDFAAAPTTNQYRVTVIG